MENKPLIDNLKGKDGWQIKTIELKDGMFIGVLPKHTAYLKHEQIQGPNNFIDKFYMVQIDETGVEKLRFDILNLDLHSIIWETDSKASNPAPKNKSLKEFWQKNQLTNKAIAENFRDIEYVLCLEHFTSAFSYWCYLQADNPEIKSKLKHKLIADAVRAYEKAITFSKNPTFAKVDDHFHKRAGGGYKHKLGEAFKILTYSEIDIYVNASLLENIPEVEKMAVLLRIDLGALSRNVFYQICRNYIAADACW